MWVHRRRGGGQRDRKRRGGLRRAEEWAEGLGAHDLVVARAVGPQPVVLEYAAPLLRLGGALVDWRGRRDPEEERQALPLPSC